MKRGRLRPGAKSVERGSTFQAELGAQLRRAAIRQASRRPVSAASGEQRVKVQLQGCRLHGPACSGPIDPAHTVSRALGGCDFFDCVIPLCRDAHRAFDAHRLDILPLLTHEEQAHAVSHLGIVAAYHRLTGRREIA